MLDSSRTNSATGSWASSSSPRSRSRDSLSYCSGDETLASFAVENDGVLVRGSNDDEEDEEAAFDDGRATRVTLVATPTVSRFA